MTHLIEIAPRPNAAGPGAARLARPVEAGRGGPCRLVRPGDPHVALARAVELCARHPAFGDRPFGQWARVLIGQVNRGQFRFVLRGIPGGPDERPDERPMERPKDRIVGFAGWFRTSRAGAERWLAGTEGGAQDRAGDSVVLNALVAEDPGVIRAILAQARTLEPAPYTLFARRAYPDGRTRPVRLAVPARTGAGDIASGGP